MRKFDFDTLGMADLDWIDFFTSFVNVTDIYLPLNLSFAAPQIPIFNMNNGTNLTNGDDVYDTLVDGEVVNALDGNDLITVFHDDVSVNGGAGDDVLRIASDQNLYTVDTVFDGGSGYDTASFITYQVPGMDTYVFLDVRAMSFVDVEAITLSYELHPTDDGPGGSGGMIFEDSFEINYSQLATINHFDIIDILYWEIRFTAADTIIDFRTFTSAGDSGAYLYNTHAVDKTIYLDTININEGLLAAGEDTIYVTYDATKSWRADFYEWEANISGQDVLDFSLMATVDDGMGGTLGTLTHTMTRVTQTGLGLSSDSRIKISNIDEYYGWDGEDIFIGDARDNYFDGNGGTDVAVYSSANIADYIVIETAPGEYSIEVIGGTGEGTDTLTGVEIIRLGGIDGIDYAIEDLVNNGNTIINLTNGDDDFTGTESNETINGLDGDDIIRGEGGNDTIYGGAGRDHLYAGSGDDILYGGEFGDTLYAGTGNNILVGGENNDSLRGVYGSSSTSTAVYSSASLEDYDFVVTFDDDNNWTASVTSRNGVSDGNDFLTDIDSIRLGGIDGTDYNLWEIAGVNTNENTYLTNDDDNYTWCDANCNDAPIIHSLDGNDKIFTFPGASVTVYAGSGDDEIYSEDDDLVYAGDGDDKMFVLSLYVTNDDASFNGDAGTDTLSFYYFDRYYGSVLADPSLAIDLDAQIYSVLDGGVIVRTEGFTGFEIITGSLHADVAQGDANDNHIESFEGDDTLNGRAGDDTLDGGDGIDTAVYSSANTADYIVTEIAPGEYSIEAIGGTGEGTDTLTGIEFIRLGGIDGIDYDISTFNMTGGTNLTNGDDTYTSTHNEIVNGLDGNDTLTAGGFTSTLNGDGGDDILDDNFRDQTTLNGGTGADTIYLSAAQSVANGGDDNDTIYISFDAFEAHGDAGDDVIDAEFVFGFPTFMTLTGGVGTDTLIVSFDDGTDSDNVNRYGGTVDMSTGMGSGDYNFTASGFEALDFTGGGETDNVTGTAGDDIIRDGGFYTFFGGAGGFFPGNGNNDTLNGAGGNDTIIGTGGIDTLSGGAGDDTITSGATQVFTYDDLGDTGTITRNAEAKISGGDGNDTINSFGNDTIDAGSGDDFVLFGQSERDNTTATDGGTGVDTLSFANLEQLPSGNIFLVVDLSSQAYSIRDVSTVLFTDTFTSFENVGGSDFGDLLQGDAGANLLTGFDGDDLLQGREGDDMLLGGAGSDTAIYTSSNVNDYVITETAPGEYMVEAVGGTGEGTDTLVDVEFLRLGGTDYDITALAGGGTVTLTNGDDIYMGPATDVIVNALDGDDIIDGGAGNNTLNGGAGDDTLISLGNDILNGGTGNDTVEMGGNVFDAATATDGGAGFDTLSFSTLAQLPSGNLFLVLDLQSQAYSVRDGGTVLYVDSFTNFENATGSEFGDLLQGDAGANLLSGLGGDDNLQGRDGDDIIEGGAGDDILNGDAGDDILYGGTGNNILNGGEGDDTLISGGSFNVFDGGAGIDTLSYAETAGTVLVDLLTGATGNAAFGDSFSGIENITSAIFGGILRGDSSDNVLIGSGFVDTLVGRNGNDTLIGEAGDDTLQGGRGEDILFGGAGDDTLEGAQSSEVDNDFAVYLSIDPADYIVTHLGGVTYSVQAVSTNEGTDTLTGIDFIRLGGLDGTDYAIETLVNNVLTINLTEGVDVFSGTEADEIINALGNHDIIDGGGGNNTLNGDAGNDTLISLGNDILNGGRGNDTIEMGGNIFDVSTATDGGTGIDTLSFSTLAQLPSGTLFLVVDLQGQAYSVRDGGTVLYVDPFTNFENATGSEFGDLLQGDAGANLLSGLGGDDNLQGRDGDDVIDGGAGADILNGGVGADTATYASALAGVTAIMGNAALNTGDALGDSYLDIENITGSDFDDTLGGDASANVIDGEMEVDIASYSYASSAIFYDGLGLVTASGEITNDTLLNIEAIRGTDFNDSFFGDNDASIFYGGTGADRLFGRNGDDQLYGEGGNDIILAGRDNDLLDGGDGNDQLRGNEGDDTLIGGDGNDVLAGGAGADVLDGGAGIDRVEYTYGTNAGVTASLGDASINTGDAAGDSYIDIENLYGTSFADTLYGDAGNNRVDGRVGDDILFGGDGNDYLIGGAGDDVLNGEGGNDLLLGQTGTDIYQFDAAHGTDRIIIFTQGEDFIEFTENVFDFSDLTITQDGAHVNIDTGEGTIIVNNSLVADFASDDFIFASPPSQEPLDIVEQDMSMIYEVDALI